ncbi:hypothetical protein Cch01nite_05420 [Cellulomonas chitinilytica]|uniref:Integral membrane protein n=1 Tax=Cellulomonas chitinilytica TaxID=398759 RepID=A0A919NY83_9CELL|nr:hypothetical protein [Cellulomonas chitinilytica]GIG19818.1 hypothetical protein Cch01nite_05420 [Cellulomonas chitinilytica]
MAVRSRPNGNDEPDEPGPGDTQPIAGAGDTQPLPVDDVALLRSRLEALEAENARLRSAAAAAPAVVSSEPPRRRRPGRATAAVVLVVVAALLAPVAVVAVWAKGLAEDTDRYLATVAPLSDDPQIQSAVTNRLTTAIVDAVNLEDLAQTATGAVADLGLPPRLSAAVLALQGPLVDAATNFIRKGVDRVVTSDAFSTAWEQANKVAHEQIVALMRGDPDAIASIDSQGTLTVDLTPVIEQVKTALSNAGFTIVDRIPTINATFPLAQSSDLVRLQNAYRALDVLGTWLPWIVVALLAGGVMLSQNRSRALVVAGLTLAGAMLVLGLVLTVGRSVYANSLPPEVQRPDAAVVVYDQVVSLLRISLRSAFVIGVVVAAVAFVSGRSDSAVALRSASARSAAWLRGAGERRGVTTGPVGEWLGEQRVLVRVVVAIGAALALVLGTPLTPGYVLGVAIVAVVVLLLVSLLARPPLADDRASAA